MMDTFLDKYFELKKQLDEIRDEVYPRIQEICEVCTRFDSEDRIENIEIEEEDPLWLDEPEVIVNVENRSCGPDTYYFPKRYLSMTIEEIKAAEKEAKEREEEEARKKKYQLFLELKKEFEEKEVEE